MMMMKLRLFCALLLALCSIGDGEIVDSLCRGWSKKFPIAVVSYGISKVFERDDLFLDIIDAFMRREIMNTGMYHS